MKNEDLKKIVKDKYSQIVIDSNNEQESCCCCGSDDKELDYSVFNDDYSNIKGYNADADLSLGCGLPTEYAKISKGDTVIDLGSGAGNDCFVARTLVGDEGEVIGIDFTDEMIRKAIENTQKIGFKNVKFRKGDIEEMPVTANKADVIISNCVLNLVPDKSKAFSEILRVLKPGAHFSISDVVLIGQLPENISKAAELYAGCVSGALQKHDYMNIIKELGFVNIEIVKEKPIIIPDDILLKYITENELKELKNSELGIFSITVYAEKPNNECCC